MSPTRSGLVFLHLSPAMTNLPEYLAELGYDIAQSQWGLTDREPRVVVSDQPIQLAGIPRLMDAVQGGRTGLILVGEHDLPPTPARSRADVRLPGDATGREVATAIDLVAELSENRRRLDHEREECRRWIDLAMHDSLTGLPNRRAWDEQLAVSLAGKTMLCIGLIDVDFFKRVNEQSGHSTGDLVLREVGRSLRSKLRSGDFVARLGGDEFGIILRQVDDLQAAAILQRLRHAASAHLAHQRLPAPTLSAGYVVLSPQVPRDATSVFAAAATSLQAAKHEERNRIVAFTPDMQQSEP